MIQEGSTCFDSLFEQFRLQFSSHRYTPTSLFQGSLRELMIIAANMGDLCGNPQCDLEQLGTVMGNTWIWSLNQSADDANDQSMIVSCTLPREDMSFVFTGDARDLVFKTFKDRFREQIINQDTVYDFRDWLKAKAYDDNHIVWLSLPHHGSEDNVVPHAREFFQPNSFFVSVGSTSTFGHPSYPLIRNIRKFYKESSQGMKLTNYFYNKFQSKPTEGCDFVAVTKTMEDTPGGKTKTAYHAHQVKMFGHQNNSVPILCPNIRGHISIVQIGTKETYIRSHGFRTCLNGI